MKMKDIAVKAVLCGLLIVMPITNFAADMMKTPEMMGEVSYVSGGIGESELEMMQGRAKDYLLEFVFVQKLKQKEEYLADVKVKIQDVHHNVVLETVTEGPYLFLNLPEGRYSVSAEYRGDVKLRNVYINTKKHQKVVFWWPIVGQTEPELESEE
jgi:hypothetical protein